MALPTGLTAEQTFVAVMVSITCAACVVVVIRLHQCCCYQPPVVRTAARRRARPPKGQGTRRTRRQDHEQRAGPRLGSRPAAYKHQSRRALAIDEDALLTFGGTTIHAVEDGCNAFKFRRAEAGETVEVYEVDDEITPDDSVSVAMWNNMPSAPPPPLPRLAPCRCKCGASARPAPGGRGLASVDGDQSQGGSVYGSQVRAPSSSSRRRGLEHMVAVPELSEGPTAASAAPTFEARWMQPHAHSKLPPLPPPPPCKPPAVRRPPELVPNAAHVHAPVSRGRLRHPQPPTSGGDDITMVALSTMPRSQPNTRSLAL